jgi:argininosuccinate lyase
MDELLQNKETIDPFGIIGGRKDTNILDEERKVVFIKSIHKEIPLFIKVHQAWLLMLVKQKIVDEDRARKIMKALVSFDEQAIKEMIDNWNPAGWEPMVQLEHYLTAQVGQVASDLNIARTIPPPFYRMELLPLLFDLIEETINFLEMLLSNAGEHLLTVMPGYTHLQHAQPMTYGHYLIGLFDPMARALRQLEDAYTGTNQFELGCGALSGTSFDIDREYPAELLAFDGVVEHSNDAVAATDFIIDILASLMNMFIPLSRVANDLDIWSSFEFSIVEVADEICNPSSMMPQKKNPAIFEFCRMALGQILGAFTEVVCGSHAVQYGDVIEMRELAFSIHPKLTEAVKQIRIMNRAIDTLIIKKERMLELAKKGFSTATELAAVLYREASVPLRLAHGIVAEVVRKMIQEGKTADDITPEVVADAALKVSGNRIEISPVLLKSSIDPVNFVKVHSSRGGVSPDSLKNMITSRRKLIETHRHSQAARLEKRARADRLLKKQVHSFLGKH